MEIRRAEIKDLPKIMDLLSQVLEIHAEIRPDIFVSGTTKYSVKELKKMLKNSNLPIFVAVDNDDVCAYVFCAIVNQPASDNTVSFSSLYIDDFCVDSKYRGKGIGQTMFEYVKMAAKSYGCYEITLNVWEGNDGARAFYEHLGMKPQKTKMEYIL